MRKLLAWLLSYYGENGRIIIYFDGSGHTEIDNGRGDWEYDIAFDYPSELFSRTKSEE